MAKKQQIPQSQTSNGEAKQASTVFPCDQCDYLGASETGLKQHVTMKHKKAEGTPALRSQEESSRSVIGSPLPLHNREENCQNCDGTFSPGHQCDESEDDDGLSDSEEEESNEASESPVVTLLWTLSSLSDDQKRAALDVLSQLNSNYINQI